MFFKKRLIERVFIFKKILTFFLSRKISHLLIFFYYLDKIEKNLKFQYLNKCVMRGKNPRRHTNFFIHYISILRENQSPFHYSSHIFSRVTLPTNSSYDVPPFFFVSHTLYTAFIETACKWRQIMNSAKNFGIIVTVITINNVPECC